MNENIKNILLNISLEIKKMSHRENVNSIQNFFTRRKKYSTFKFLIEQFYENWDIPEDVYKDLKDKIFLLMMENFSQMILPEKSWIISPKDFKTEQYLNMQKLLWIDVLEPREYIWIVPEAHSDLDAPSLVTADTPANYEQPWHDHSDNWEITFYTWKSKWKYMFDWKEYEIDADFWDFIIFPPKTFHTIQNPNDFPIKNMSVKLPWALLDRGKTYNNTWWKWFLKKMEEISPWVKKATFEEQWVPYFSKLYSFSKNISSHDIETENKSLLYVLDWAFIIDWLPKKEEVVTDSFAVILDAWEKINIKTIKEKGNIYMIELLDNWENFSKNKK